MINTNVHKDKTYGLSIPIQIIIIIIVGFIERTYLIETTTQGALQHIITPMDLFPRTLLGNI